MVELTQHGVERRGLSGSRWPRHDDDAAGHGHDFLQLEKRFGVECQCAHAEARFQMRLVEQTHGDVVAAIRAMALVANADDASVIACREAARDSWTLAALFRRKTHEVQKKSVNTVLELQRHIDFLPEIAVDAEAIVTGGFLGLD